MKYCVGFQLLDGEGEPYSSMIEAYAPHISEVFFSWQDIASGRSAVATCHGYTDWSAQERMTRELRRLKTLGIKLDLLFNGNCYGEYALSERLANTVRSVIDYLHDAVGGVEIVTTASPAIAHTVRRHYPSIELRASVNMRIGTVKGMQYLCDLFDSFHVQRDYNRDLARLRELRDWADGAGKRLVMLANSGCFRDCSGQSFHDNLVAHESEICEVRNLDDFNPYVCWRALKDPENWHFLLENTWVRPEDIHHYEGIFDTVKLATRMHQLPGMVIDAYVRGRYIGNTLDLFEPGFGRALAPYIVDNTAFPADWFERTSACSKRCHECSYCRETLSRVLLHTGDTDL